MNKYKHKGCFDLLNYISEHATLVQVIYSLCNLNHALSVVGYCIFESNYEKSLVLNRELLDIICDPSVGEEQFSKFEIFIYAVRYIRLTAQLKRE